MRRRICIVDHDLAGRGYLRECLEKEGYSVVTLEDGSQVRPYLQGGTFDAYILDIETPGVKEKEFLLDIKKTGQPRILLTVSKRGDAFLKEAMEMGVYGFLYKPFNPNEICTMVNYLLR